MKWCKEEKLKFIKEMEINYGVRYSENDEIVPLYHYLHHNGKQLDSQLTVAKDLINQLEIRVQEIKKQTGTTVYNFSNGEAWKWQWGRAVVALVIGWWIFMLGYIWVTYRESESKLTNAKEILAKYPIGGEQLMQRIKLAGEGYYYLEFRKQKGSTIKDFEEYIELQNNGVVTVPLGTK